MAIVRTSDAVRYLGALPSGVFLVLLHGDNTGLVSLLGRTLGRNLAKSLATNPGASHEKIEILQMEGDAVAANPEALLDEAYAVSMFSDMRAARIFAGRKSLVEALEPLLERPPAKFFVIVECGLLRRDAPLRLLVEASPCAAAVECLPDSGRELAGLVADEARLAGVKIEPDARDLLVSLLPSDRMASKAEIEKLFLYVGAGATINIEHIRQCVTNGATLLLQELVDTAFAGDRTAFDALALRYLFHDVETNSSMAALLWHAILLHRARASMHDGRSAETAAAGATRQGLYSSRRAVFEKQLTRLETGRLLSLIAGLNRITAQNRKMPRLAAASVAGIFGQLANMGPARKPPIAK